MQKLFSAVLVALMALAGGALAQTFTLTQTFPNPSPGPNADDRFGNAVAAVGNKILVGASQDDALASNSGVVYLFNAASSTPELTIVNPNPAAGALFGAAVAAFGTHLLVGAPGANKVYLLDGGTGNVITTFSNPEATADEFGFAIAVAGSNVLIGAPAFKIGIANNVGRAYLFDTNGPNATLLGNFCNPSPAAGERFGAAVAAVGNNFLIGAPGVSSSTGEAYLFTTAEASCPPSQTPQTIMNPGTAGSQFGNAIAAIGTNVLISAFRGDTPTTDDNAGIAYLFDVSTNPPTVIRDFQNPAPGNLNQYGNSVAAFGNSVLAAIGANLNDPGGVFNAGAVYLYDVTMTSPIATLQQSPTPISGDRFGDAIAAGGNNLIISAPFHDAPGTTNNEGVVYLFSSNAPPDANAGEDQIVECTSPSGTPVTLDGSGSSDPNGDPLTYTWRENGNIIAGPTNSATSQVSFSLGSHTVELTVEDGKGGTDTDVVVINVVDTTPPVITLQPAITLWPPNHKYTTINVADIVVSVNDACAGSIPVSNVKIASVSSDEPDDAPDVICLIDDPLHVCYNGDGSTTNDVVIAGDCNSVQLRKERAASGNGRVYTINLQVSDASGNVTTAAFKVSVPHDQGSGAVAVENVPYYIVNCASAKVASNSGKDDIAAPALPKGYALSQNYPNPFNPTTDIRFELPETGHVTVKIFSVLGENIRTLADTDFPAGVYVVGWNAQNERGEKVPSGVYFYQLVTPSFTATKRMILAK